MHANAILKTVVARPAGGAGGIREPSQQSAHHAKSLLLPSILPKRLACPDGIAWASGLSQQLASAATCEGDKLVPNWARRQRAFSGRSRAATGGSWLNAVAQEERHTYRDLLLKALLNPLVILLSLLAGVQL